MSERNKPTSADSSEAMIERHGIRFYPDDELSWKGKVYRFDELPEEAFADMNPPETIVYQGRVIRVADLSPSPYRAQEMAAFLSGRLKEADR